MTSHDCVCGVTQHQAPGGHSLRVHSYSTIEPSGKHRYRGPATAKSRNRASCLRRTSGRHTFAVMPVAAVVSRGIPRHYETVYNILDAVDISANVASVSLNLSMQTYVVYHAVEKDKKEEECA